MALAAQVLTAPDGDRRRALRMLGAWLPFTAMLGHARCSPLSCRRRRRTDARFASLLPDLLPALFGLLADAAAHDCAAELLIEAMGRLGAVRADKLVIKVADLLAGLGERLAIACRGALSSHFLLCYIAAFSQ